MPTPPSDLATQLLAELGWVRRLARRLVGDGEEDLAHDVAALALERGPRDGGLRAWLGAVVRKRAARLRRDAKRRNEVERVAELVTAGAVPNPEEHDPVAVVERLLQQQRLARSVLELPEPYRSVVVARYFDQQRAAEIARERGVSAATVRQQLARGLAQLRVQLQRDQGSSWRARCVLCIGSVGAPSTPAGVFAMVGAGQLVSLEIRDPIGRVLATGETKLPPAGQTQRIRLPIEQPPAVFSGTVVRDGLPVAAATVLARDRTKHGSQSARTDRQGRFSMQIARSARPVVVAIDHPRWARLVDVLPSASGWTKTYSLQPALRLDVRVVDPAGGLVQTARIRAAHPQMGGLNERIEPGHERFRRLPPGPFEVSIRIEKRRLTRTVDPAVSRLLEVRTPR